MSTVGFLWPSPNRRRAFLVFVLVPGLLATGGLGDDALDRKMEKLAPKAIDCGRVPLNGENRSAVNECVSENFLADRSFRARFQCLSDDSECWWGLVLTSRPGGVAVVLYDSMGCMVEPTATCGTTVQYCDDAKLIPIGDRLKVRCIREFEF